MALKKDTITVTSPLLPDLDEFQLMLKEIWDSKWVTNNGQFPVGTGTMRIPQGAVYQPVHQRYAAVVDRFAGIENHG